MSEAKIVRLDAEILRLEKLERSAKSFLAAESYAYDIETAKTERRKLQGKP